MTVSHFSLPTWVHDPIAAATRSPGAAPDEALPQLQRGGWLSSSTVREFRKYAAYLAWKLGQARHLLDADQRAARGRRERLT